MRLLFRGSIGLALGGAVAAIACGHYNDQSCDDFHNCAGSPVTVDDGGLLPDGAPVNVDAGADSGVPGCNASSTPSQDPCVINDALAIFVSPTGSDSNAGTMASPVLTLGKGISLALTSSAHRVIACAATYQESLSLSAPSDDVGLAVFGGVTCPGGSATGWSYTGARAVVTSASAQPALQATGLTKGLTLQDMELDGPSTNPATNGASSVGAFVSGVTSASFTNVKFVAKDATPGVAGGSAPPTNHGTGSLDGNSAGADGGGAPKQCSCVDSSSSTGGAGGWGGTEPTPGLPALGGGAAGSNLTGGTCTNGGVGQDAPPSGQDGGVAPLGSLAAAGWSPAPGVSGTNGGPGQGGGGGGDDGTGGGGGGACGGCGGAGGEPGQGGGASIALLAFESAVTAAKCEFVAGAAGTGGQGGQGEAGQAGSNVGGLQSMGGCPGGAGGSGAGGNGGGGGSGGVSAGIAYAGTPPTIDGSLVSAALTLGNVSLGTAAAGGTGGAAGPAATTSHGSPHAGNTGPTGTAGIAQAVVQLQ